MPDPMLMIPLAEIDEAAMIRDRSTLDEDALQELRSSIAVSGLRMPIEVYAFAEPTARHRYGLISGFRRLAAMRGLHELTGQDRYAVIPAFVRTPKDDDDLVRQMVEENAIRAEISPWEQAMVAVRMGSGELLPGIDAAVQKLYGNLSRDKRTRLRAIAHLAEELAAFSPPRDALPPPAPAPRAVIPRGFGDLIRATLEGTRATDPDFAVGGPPADPARGRARRRRRGRRARPPRPPPPGAPPPRRDLTVRREMTRDGWALHFTGDGATAPARRGLRRGRAHVRSAAAARPLPAPPTPARHDHG